MRAAEKELNKKNWDPEPYLNRMIQLDADREPLLTWKATEPEQPYPINYAVPNFGRDHDINTTHKSLDYAQKEKGKWNLKKDEDGNWILPPREHIEWRLYDDRPLNAFGVLQTGEDNMEDFENV